MRIPAAFPRGVARNRGAPAGAGVRRTGARRASDSLWVIPAYADANTGAASASLYPATRNATPAAAKPAAAAAARLTFNVGAASILGGAGVGLRPSHNIHEMIQSTYTTRSRGFLPSS